ncbi:MAG: hypothetical protein O2902_04930 [Actinobacteria bacterium]|jgi:hypothetical protein|nr:hypothetical protein [Actinomycetota bacterium]
MSKDPLAVDGLRAVVVITGVWIIALVGQLAGWLQLDREILSYGVLIGFIIIIFLTRRRRRRQ